MNYKSTVGKEIELTQERKNYFLTKHPELKPHFSKIKAVLSKPDEIRVSKHDEKVLLFYKFFGKILEGKYVVVVVKTNTRNFIVTAHITDKIKAGRKYEK